MAEKSKARETTRRPIRKPAPTARPAGAEAVRRIVDDASNRPKAYVDRFVVPSEGE